MLFLIQNNYCIFWLTFNDEYLGAVLKTTCLTPSPTLHAFHDQQTRRGPTRKSQQSIPGIPVQKRQNQAKMNTASLSNAHISVKRNFLSLFCYPQYYKQYCQSSKGHVFFEVQIEKGQIFFVHRISLISCVRGKWLILQLQPDSNAVKILEAHNYPKEIFVFPCD